MPLPILPSLSALRALTSPARPGVRRRRQRGPVEQTGRALTIAAATVRRINQIQNLASPNALNAVVGPMTKRLFNTWYNRNARITQRPPLIGPIHAPAQNGAFRLFMLGHPLLRVTMNGPSTYVRVNLGVLGRVYITSHRYDFRDLFVPLSSIIRTNYYNRYLILLSLYDPVLGLIAGYALYGPSLKLALAYWAQESARALLEGWVEQIREQNAASRSNRTSSAGARGPGGGGGAPGG